MSARGNRLNDLAFAAARRTINALFDRVYATRLYRLSLRGPMPDHMVHQPEDLRPGTVDTANALFQGRYDLPGGQVRTNGRAPWRVEPPNETWAEELNGFGWLRHFAAAGGETATRHARELVITWIQENGEWDDIAWRPHVIGRRLISWVSNGRLLLGNSDMIYRSTVLRNMAQQARHLARTAASAPMGLPRMTAAMGLAFSGLCLSEGDARLEKGIALICRELDEQILADGGHVTRNPAAQLSVLLDLISLRDALTARGHQVPKQIRECVDRMAPMLRFFRHGDGRLALFNGAGEGPAGAIDAALARDEVDGKPFGFAPHSGYHRVSAGSTLLIVDAGAPPPGPYSTEAHAGCLAFELSRGPNRIVTNCGTTVIFGADWEMASRATAAHSTLTLADTSSARMIQGRFAQRLLGARVMAGPDVVDSQRDENEGGTWLEMSHDGYRAPFGVIHTRRLYLDANGLDLRGEDRLERTAPGGFALTRPKTDPEPDFALRFHLHPDVRASLSRDGSSVLVVLPNGEGWRFRASGGDVAIEETVYLGAGDTVRRAEQIVVTGRLVREDATVRWAWRMAGAEPEGPAGTAQPGDAEV